MRWPWSRDLSDRRQVLNEAIAASKQAQSILEEQQQKLESAKRDLQKGKDAGDDATGASQSNH